MLILIGLPVAQSLRALQDAPWARFVSRQLEHSKWHGFTYIDLGLAGFILTVGASVALAFPVQPSSLTEWRKSYRRIVVRSCSLFLFGVVYSGGFEAPWPEVRLAGVLQRIAVCYFCASIAMLHLTTRQIVAAVLLILFVFSGVLLWWSFPGYVAGDLSRDGNFAGAVDRSLLPGRLAYGDFDPEGLGTTIPAVASCLIGVVIGKLLASHNVPPIRKFSYLLGSSLLLMNLGVLMDAWIPINKQLWTPSFIVFTAGLGGCLHMAVFYLIVDVWKSRLLFPLMIFGQHSLAAYLIGRFVRTDALSASIFGGISRIAGQYGVVVLACGQILLVWLMLYYFHRATITQLTPSRD